MKRLNGQMGLTCAMLAGMATIIILVMLEWITRALLRCRYFMERGSLARSREGALHGKSIFVNAMDRDSQHDHEHNTGEQF